MILSQSVSSLDATILKTLIPPKPKPKLTTFRRYYTRSLSNHRERFDTSLGKNRPIDDYLVDKIQRLAPDKINRQFSKTMSKSQKIKTQKSEMLSRPSQKIQSMMDTLRRKSLMIAKEATLHECRVKKQTSKKSKKIFAFEVREIKWAQQKWGNGRYQGKYSEKLHPICLIYQDFAQKTATNFNSLPDPFEDYQHIQF